MSDPSPIAFEHVAVTGATFVQSPLVWPRVAPKVEPTHWDPADPGDPHYDWRAVDAWVTATAQQGLTPVLQVSGAPRWAQSCNAPIPSETAVCGPDPAKLTAFAHAASLRYSGRFEGLPRVRYWQGLNEPNLSLFFNPQFEGGRPVSAALYRKLINVFYFAVKSVDPSNLVLAAGLGPIAVSNLTIGPMSFARELLCMVGRRNPQPTAGNCEGGVHFDIFDIHPYTTGGPTHKGGRDDVELGSLDRLQELLSAADRAGRIQGAFRHTPLWITELSWDSKPPDPGGVSMRILTRWTAEALYRAWSAGVSHFFWYSLRDEAPGSRSFSETLQSGLYFRGATIAEDRPKPSMYAFRFPFVAYSEKRRGFSFWGRTGSSTGGRVLVEVLTRGRWRRAAVAHADAAGIFQGSVRTTYGRNEHGSVRARYRRETSVPFSLYRVKDFRQAPFGNPVG